MKEQFQNASNFSNKGQVFTAFNTTIGAVILNNSNNDITVSIPHLDRIYGMSDLTAALNEIGWDWSKE